jgi:uncharacterized delta-60 repeat protein
LKLIFTIAAVILVLSAPVAYGQIVGGLDTTFGTGGKVTTLVTYTSGANAVTLQNDGKIVAAGYGFNGTNYEFAVARYDTDGAIDTTFGLEGIDTTRIRSGNSFANAVAIEPNGKIILAGKSSDANYLTVQFALARYTSSGLPDSTFGTNGIDTFTIDTFKGGSIDDEANGIAIQPDGKILVSGFSNYGKSNGTKADFALIRVDTNGVLDTSFNKTGKVLTAIGPNNDRGYGVAIQRDGKILVSGGTNNGSTRVFALVRYDSTGIVDSSFGKKGVASVDFWGNSDLAYSIAFQPSGKIILGGITIGSSTSFALTRIDTDGTIDNTFGTNGLDTSHFYGYDDEIRSIAIDSIGRIIAAGFAYNTNSTLDDIALARYDTSGIIDTTFVDSTGKVALDIGTTNDTAKAVVIQHNGKILMAGCVHNAVKEQFALVRYDVTKDTANNNKDTITGVVKVAVKDNSLFVYPNPAQDEVLLQYTLANDETLTIRIYDLLGRVVQSVITNETEQAGTYTEMLNLEALAAGCYIINLSNNSSQNLSIKLIKQ